MTITTPYDKIPRSSAAGSSFLLNKLLISTAGVVRAWGSTEK
ncbi:MAG TPA: hypothetical protein VN328_09555 [Thermodesulfovibrionales bacterium]|nr:hypothetical protein [Thermodesulfovibrionales bacterium]